MIGRIGVVVHNGRPAARAAAETVRRWAAGNGIECVDIDVWGDDRARLSAVEEAERAGNPDLIVTIGGDGTFLRGARVAAPTGALLLGVDVGRIGFLTEVPADGVDAALDAVHAGRNRVEKRITLTMRASRELGIPPGIAAWLRYGRGPTLPPPQRRPDAAEQIGWGVPLDISGLNDVVFEKLARDRQASVAVYVDSHHFASYSADALIVSSPTGSTAYNFAAGGPILSPQLQGMVFTPVAPHMVFGRSLVLALPQRIGVLVLERSGQVAVSVDGQLRGVLDPGDWISVYAGPQAVRLVRLTETPFLDRVRERFHLADAEAAVADGTSPAVYDPHVPLPPDLAHPGPVD